MSTTIKHNSIRPELIGLSPALSEFITLCRDISRQERERRRNQAATPVARISGKAARRRSRLVQG
jgi:hypothetical protein